MPDGRVEAQPLQISEETLFNPEDILCFLCARVQVSTSSSSFGLLAVSSHATARLSWVDRLQSTLVRLCLRAHMITAPTDTRSDVALAVPSERSVGHASPVYALLLPSKDVDQDIKRLPSIPGYSWKRSNGTDTTAVIVTLTKDAAVPSLEPAHDSVER